MTKYVKEIKAITYCGESIQYYRTPNGNIILLNIKPKPEKDENNIYNMIIQSIAIK